MAFEIPISKAFDKFQHVPFLRHGELLLREGFVWAVEAARGITELLSNDFVISIGEYEQRVSIGAAPSKSRRSRITTVRPSNIGEGDIVEA